MPNRFLLTLFSRIALLSLFSPLLLAQNASQSAPPAAAVQTSLTRAAAPDRALAIALMRDLAANRATYRSDMRPMYHRMEYRGLWVSPMEGKISAAGTEALATLASAQQWGLLGSYTSGLKNISAERRYSAPQLAQLELKITNAVLWLLADLANGQLDQSNPELRWGIQPVRVSFRQLMTELAKGTPVPKMAENLSKQRFGQSKLLAELAAYEDIVAKGGWPLVLSDKLLKPGMVDAAVVTLRRRLAAENYNVGKVRSGQPAQLYDRALAEVVRRFQANHGLKPDGEIGPSTQLALNLPAQLRRDQILANLERLRWLPQELGANRVWVNIPAFRLQLVDNNKTKLDMAVVVGRKQRPTPVFDDLISQVEVNPTWNVPTTIAFEDYLPELRKNPLYLKKKNIRVFENWNKGAKELDPRKVNWQGVNDKNRRWFPYRLTQDPGGNNALGRVKFLFPNQHSVYLHDTPERYLFNRQSRALSSGCVRVEEPTALANYLLSELLGSSANYAQLRATKKTRRLFLDGSLPVYLTYFTAWVDEFDQLQFRDDIYGHDRPLLQMLGDISARNPRLRPVPPAVPRPAPAKPALLLTANEIPVDKRPVKKASVSANIKLKPTATLRKVSAQPTEQPVTASQPGAVAKKSPVVASEPGKEQQKPKPVQLTAARKAESSIAGNSTGNKAGVAKSSGATLKVSAGQPSEKKPEAAKDVTVVPVIGTNKFVLTKSENGPLPTPKPVAKPRKMPTKNTAIPVLVETRRQPVMARGDAVLVPVARVAKLQSRDVPAKALPVSSKGAATSVVKLPTANPAAKPALKTPSQLQAQPSLKLKQSQVVKSASQPLPAVIKPKPAVAELVEAPAVRDEAPALANDEDQKRSARRYRGPRGR